MKGNKVKVSELIGQVSESRRAEIERITQFNYSEIEQMSSAERAVLRSSLEGRIEVRRKAIKDNLTFTGRLLGPRGLQVPAEEEESPTPCAAPRQAVADQVCGRLSRAMGSRWNEAVRKQLKV